jgi:hypothetical protein
MSQAMLSFVTPESMAFSNSGSLTQSKILCKAKLSRRVSRALVKKTVLIGSHGRRDTPAFCSSTCSPDGSALLFLSDGSARERLVRPVANAFTTDVIVEQVRN